MNMTFLILIVIIIFCVYLLYQGIINPSGKKRKDALQTFMLPDEKVIHEQHAAVSYLGGHPPFGQPFIDGSMVITDRRVIFFRDSQKGIFSIPYEDMASVSIETKESLTVTRVALVGIFAPLWKAKKPFLLIQMKNEIGEISPVALGFTSIGMGHSEYPAWTIQQWFQSISGERYNRIKDKRISS